MGSSVAHMRPEWLPPELNLNGRSAFDDYRILYKIFTRDLLNSNLEIDGFPIAIDMGKDTFLTQYERGFTHLVTCDDGTETGSRVIDYSRAKRLCWVRPVIENYQSPEVYSFWAQAPTEEVLYLWLADQDFIVIFKWWGTTRNTKVIVTAFHVDKHRKRYYQKLYGRALRIL